MLHKDKVGRYGEDLAKKYLIRQGYKIIESNLKLSYQEIDIICLKEKILVFVEVKTRASTYLGPAEDALTSFKMKLVKRAAARFMSQKSVGFFERFRFDFIAINISKADGTAKLKHFQDIV